MMGHDTKQRQKRILLKRLGADGNQTCHKLWNQYLDLIQVGLKESQIAPKTYDYIGDKTIKPIFENAASTDNSERLQIARRVLKTLSPLQQKIVHFAFFEGMSEKEIGTRLRLSRSNVNYHKYSAIQTLRAEILANLPCMRGQTNNFLKK